MARGHEQRVRLTVLQAARQCDVGEVIAARDPADDNALVAVLRTDEGLFVVPDRCPHDGGLLSDGYIDDGRLVCARHGWEFEPTTGACPHRSACIESRRVLREPRAPRLPFAAAKSPLAQ